MAKKKQYGDSRDRLVKKQMAMYLDKAQADALAALSNRTGHPQQYYVRLGLDRLLTKMVPGYKAKADK